MTRARNSANLASDGNLFVNISDDRTGIGSLSPTHKLHVAGTSFFDDDVLFRGTDTGKNCSWDKSTRSLVFDGNGSVNGNYARARFNSSGSYSMDVYNNLNNFVEVSPNVALFVKTCDLQVIGSGSRGGTTYDGAILRARTGIVELGHEIGNGGATGYKLATTAYGVNVTGTTDTDGLVVSGVATVTTMNVTGVLTYDDVTSVDSVGIVTARQGVHIDDSITHIGDTDTKIRFPQANAINLETGGTSRLSIDTSGNVTISGNLTVTGTTTQNNTVATTTKVFTLASGSANNAAADGAGILIDAGSDTDKTLKWLDSTDRWTFTGGDVAANAFYGDGSNLTGLNVAINTLNNASNNRIITSSGGSTVNAEANLTFDGSKLIAIQTNSDIGLLVQNTTHDSQLRIEAQAANKNSTIMFADGTDGDVGMIDYDHNDNSLSFTVNTSERLRIDSSGRLRVASTTESADGAFDDLIVGNHSGNRGISILSGSSSQGALGFAKSGTLADGYVAYNHNSTATSSSMVIKSSGKIQFNAGSSEKFTITNTGALQHTAASGLSYFTGSSEYIFGSTTSSPPAGGYEAEVQIHAFKTRAQFSINAYMNNTGGPFMQFVTSRSGTKGVLGTKAISGDVSGQIRFLGDNATNYNSLCKVAEISAKFKSTPGDGDGVAAGELSFRTGDSSGGSVLERLIIDSSGRVLIGRTASRNVGGSTTYAKLQVAGTSQSDSSISLVNNENNTNGPFVFFGKTRGSSVGATTIVQSGDTLGGLSFIGADSSDTNNRTAEITAVVNGTPGNNTIPTDLTFSTSATHAGSLVERMRIYSSGRILIGNGSVEQSPAGNLDIVGDISGNGGELCLRVSNNNTADNIGALFFGNNVDKHVCMIRGTTHTAANTGEIQFHTSTTGSMTERLRITSLGGTVISKGGTMNTASGWAGLEIKSAQNTHQLVLSSSSTASNSNQARLGFKLHPSNDNERTKAAIICQGSGGGYGEVSRMMFCIDGTADNGSADGNGADERLRITKEGSVFTSENGTARSYPIIMGTDTQHDAHEGQFNFHDFRSPSGGIGGWVFLGHDYGPNPYPVRTFKIAVPENSQGTRVYQIWHNGDANYDYGGLWEIRINQWANSSRFESVSIRCINGKRDDLAVYAYNNSNGIMIRTSTIWGSVYIRKAGWDDNQRRRGSSYCAVENNGALAIYDAYGNDQGTVPTDGSPVNVYAFDGVGGSHTGGRDIENSNSFNA